MTDYLKKKKQSSKNILVALVTKKKYFFHLLDKTLNTLRLRHQNSNNT